jgi:TetR/AcrR family transcriptional repressor of mexJK operon
MKPEIKDPCVNAKRQCILNAAQKLFLQEGFRKVSIDKIVATAGVSKPTVYAHFANKSELFRAVIEERTQAMLDAARQHMTLTDSPRDFLQNYGEVFLSMIDAPDTVCMYRHVAAEVNDFPEIAKHFYAAGPKQGLYYMTQCLMAYDKLGKLHVEHPELSADMFLCTLKGKIHLERFFGVSEERTPEQIRRRVEAVVDLFLKAHQPIGKSPCHTPS